MRRARLAGYVTLEDGRGLVAVKHDGHIRTDREIVRGTGIRRYAGRDIQRNRLHPHPVHQPADVPMFFVQLPIEACPIDGINQQIGFGQPLRDVMLIVTAEQMKTIEANSTEYALSMERLMENEKADLRGRQVFDKSLDPFQGLEQVLDRIGIGHTDMTFTACAERIPWNDRYPFLFEQLHAEFVAGHAGRPDAWKDVECTLRLKTAQPDPVEPGPRAFG